jgi:GNAT superfamily N-acetyltransferase
LSVVRRATVDDLPVLVEARFAFVGEFAPDEVDDDDARSTVAAYLRRAVPSEEFLVWLVEDGGRVVSTSGMVVYERMMRSRGAGVGREGYVLNVYTYPEFRRRGYGRLGMQALLEYARDRGIRLMLLATDDGRPLYEKLGFEHDPRAYRWWP